VVIAGFVDIGEIVDHHCLSWCFEVIARFVDHHCLNLLLKI
jgi:hypothetical protein